MAQISESKGLMMKKLHKILLSVSLGMLATSGLQADLMSDAVALDVAKACDVKANGLDVVLATATKYNAETKKQGLEFKRLGITNSNYIKATTEAVKTKNKETAIKYKLKGKEKTKKFSTDYTAWRACSFAIRALQQKHEAQSTWRLAVPGDGFKY